MELGMSRAQLNSLLLKNARFVKDLLPSGLLEPGVRGVLLRVCWS